MPESNLIKVVVRIGDGDEKQKSVHFNDSFSHHLKEDELSACLKDAQNPDWKSSKQTGQEVGARLYGLLNKEGRLAKLLEDSFKRGKHLYLYFDLPPELSQLPFELLHDGSKFLLIGTETHVIRRVGDKNLLKEYTPSNKALSVLFSACSPMDLQASTLSFEKEEELILQSTDKLHVDLTTEDTGSLQGIASALEDGFDILHITGHAGIDKDEGPVFYMETDEGNTHEVGPDELYKAIRHFSPTVLFLSGCSTGKADKSMAPESFAYQMVKQGVPFVLGWGLPVSDTGASKAAADIYEFIGKGKDITYAVRAARLELEDDYSPWPLLRLFTDGSEPVPIIKAGKNPVKKSRKTARKCLKDSHVTVLETGFVGRRKAIQSGVKVLKGLNTDKNGLVITGTAGLGKSCLFGKLVERFTDRKLVVWRGEVKLSDVLRGLEKAFDKWGIHYGLEVIKAQTEYSDKIKELFRTVFKEHEFMFYFDDFEDNLERDGNEYKLAPWIIEAFGPFIIAMDFPDVTSKVVVTSRYSFKFLEEGEDLVEKKFENIPLAAFIDADLRKKAARLINIDNSKNKDLFMEFGRGNPRLLEWLDEVAREEDKYDLDELKEAVKGQEIAFIQKYIADVIAKTKGKDFHTFLHKASVYRRPVEKDAFEGMGTDALLDTGVGLTLFEMEAITGREPQYWVNPLIRETEFGTLSENEQADMHKKAFAWYDRKLPKMKEPDYLLISEAFHHALTIKDAFGAAKYAIRISFYLNNLALYREMLKLLESVAVLLDEAVIERAIKEKNEDIPILLNNFGETCRNLGNPNKAILYIEKALDIDLEVFGDTHPNVAIRYNNLGMAWQALGDNKKAIGYLEKALAIDFEIFGERHSNVATKYNNLGMAWQALGDNKKAIGYLEKALAIDLEIISERHPEVAARYNNLGMAWKALGEIKKAIGYYEKTLAILIEFSGKNHPNVATCLNNLGSACQALGEIKKAIGYYKNALVIDLEIFGERHPNVAIDLNNLGSACQALGEIKKAIGYFEKALAIDLEIFGERHPSVSNRYNNLGSAWQALGDSKKALEYFEKALAIDLEVFGDTHPNIARDFNNLGIAWQALGENKKAVEYAEKALELFMDIFGPDHPSTKTIKRNLDGLKQ